MAEITKLAKQASLVRQGSTAVENLPRHPKVKGLSPEVGLFNIKVGLK